MKIKELEKKIEEMQRQLAELKQTEEEVAYHE